MMWHEFFPPHKHECRKEAGIQKFQQKRFFISAKTVLLFRVVKNKFHHLWSPYKTFGKFH